LPKRRICQALYISDPHTYNWVDRKGKRRREGGNKEEFRRSEEDKKIDKVREG
jgi:hypothetical protein